MLSSVLAAFQRLWLLVVAFLRRFAAKPLGQDVALPISVNGGSPQPNASPSPMQVQSGGMMQTPVTAQPNHKLHDGTTQGGRFLRHPNPNVRPSDTRIPSNTPIHRKVPAPQNPILSASQCQIFSPSVQLPFAQAVDTRSKFLVRTPKPASIMTYSAMTASYHNHRGPVSKRIQNIRLPAVVITPSTPTNASQMTGTQSFSTICWSSHGPAPVSRQSIDLPNPFSRSHSPSSSSISSAQASGSEPRSRRSRSLTETRPMESSVQKPHEPQNRSRDQPSTGIHRRRLSSASVALNTSEEIIISPLLESPPPSNRSKHTQERPGPIAFPVSLGFIWDSGSISSGDKASPLANPCATSTPVRKQRRDSNGSSSVADTSADSVLALPSHPSPEIGCAEPIDVFHTKSDPLSTSEHRSAVTIHAPKNTDDVKLDALPYTEVFDLDMYCRSPRSSRHTSSTDSVYSISVNTSSSMSVYSPETSSSSVFDVQPIEKRAQNASPSTSSLSSKSVAADNPESTVLPPMPPASCKPKRFGIISPTDVAKCTQKREPLRFRDHYRSSAYSLPPTAVIDFRLPTTSTPNTLPRAIPLSSVVKSGDLTSTRSTAIAQARSTPALNLKFMNPTPTVPSIPRSMTAPHHVSLRRTNV